MSNTQATARASVLLQAESTPGGPGAVGTQQGPGAVQTGGIPGPVETGGVGPIASVGPAGGGGSVAGAAQTGSGGFPWWVVAIPIILGLLAAALAISRRRQATVVATAHGVAPSQRAYTGTTTTTTSGSMGRVSSATTAPVAAAGTVGAVGAAVASDQVECPNCGTVNSLSENFCHECGQDLRPARTPRTAAPVDVVDEYTPYLETQSRVDEQLEYVLSRPKVTIGTASGNDIVIDTAFSGAGSVAGVHAELRRDGEGFVILDRGSENGIHVNGAKVAEQVLKDNDEVQIGEVRFVYRAPARPQG